MGQKAILLRLRKKILCGETTLSQLTENSNEVGEVWGMRKEK